MEYYPPEELHVPERFVVTRYHGPLGSLALTLTPYQGRETYEYGTGVVRRDVRLNDNEIGTFDLKYTYPLRRVMISLISLDTEYRRQGIGEALYMSALDVPLPSGENPRSNGFELISTGQSDSARATWEKLVQSGHAIRLGKTEFVLR